jgi:hypothetical protein
MNLRKSFHQSNTGVPSKQLCTNRLILRAKTSEKIIDATKIHVRTLTVTTLTDTTNIRAQRIKLAPNRG